MYSSISYYCCYTEVVQRKIPGITNQANKAALNTKVAESDTKYLIPHVLLLPLNLID